MPTVPNDALSGLALSQATSSFAFAPGKPFLPNNTIGAIPISEIGSKSFTTS